MTSRSLSDSRQSLRRRVLAAGGYYSRESRSWVLPGARANMTPWAVNTVWCASLEEAAELCAAHAQRRHGVYEFARGEEALVR